MADDNPYRMTLDELARSTGHAPGAETHEVEPEVEVPHDLPLRVTPMSPVSEVYAIGQMTQARPTHRGAARAVALVWLGLVVLATLYGVAARLW